jgi:hypothetical protein
MNKYTATVKNRACTRKAYTRDKVEANLDRMIDKIDRNRKREKHDKEENSRIRVYIKGERAA